MIMSRIAPGVVFIFAVIPTTLILKIKGSDILGLRLDKGLQSYRKKSDPLNSEDMKKPYGWLSFIEDPFGFMRERKKFWLAPIIMLLLLLGALLVFAQGSAVAPFIYTLF